MNIRRGAPLEMPHTLLLMDDRTDSVLSLAEKAKDTLEKVYDFDLMLGGGHIAGWRVSGETKAAVQSALDALDKPHCSGKNTVTQRKTASSPLPSATATTRSPRPSGSGRKSAKLCRKTSGRPIPPASRSWRSRTSMSRQLDFEPIHRVIFDTDTSAFAAEFTAHRTEWEAEDKTLGERVAAAESFCRAYIAAHGGYIDYIHGDDTARSLGEKPNCAAVLLPPGRKERAFPFRTQERRSAEKELFHGQRTGQALLSRMPEDPLKQLHIT